MSRSHDSVLPLMQVICAQLYDRLDGGVNRYDYGILMLALGNRAVVEVGQQPQQSQQRQQSSDGSSTAAVASRWTKLAALVVAEVAAAIQLLVNQPKSVSPSTKKATRWL